ncbi:Hypothetical Protein RSKD131_3333 [Cereibacter sphaeroides KD131]|nr:Hypothetical Protein RSKD131_3333 [Cereibacter sphaeroides KD131]
MSRAAAARRAPAGAAPSAAPEARGGMPRRRSRSPCCRAAEAAGPTVAADPRPARHWTLGPRRSLSPHGPGCPVHGRLSP